MTPQRICILGSTGSIGQQTLDVIAQHPNELQAWCLTAHSNIELLAQQAHRFRPACVVVSREECLQPLRLLMDDLPEVKVLAGAHALCEVAAAEPVTTVVAALVGFAGLEPTLHAIRAGKRICLANKETLVAAGELVMNEVARHKVEMLPVDSEHSAIFQCLQGENPAEVSRLLLTCSGGPFRHCTHEDLRHVKAAEALRHPTWNMGDKITIDSATLMNKGFEVIEARWLFDIPADRIQVMVHPQSVVHSGVEFQDGSVKVQMGMPDMRLPIQYALCYPQRLSLDGQRLGILEMQKLEFALPDMERFPCLAMAYTALRRGGNVACALNAANEVVNAAFRQDRCSFTDFERILRSVMDETPFVEHPTLDDIHLTDTEARQRAEALLP